MNVSTTIPATIEIKRSRLMWLVVGVAALAAALTWAVVAIAYGGGSGSAPVARPFASGPAVADGARVPSIMELTPARLAAGALGTGYALPGVHEGPTVAAVIASMSPSTRRYTQTVTTLTFRQLAAGAAGSP